MRWVKLYVEILDDHKMALMPDNVFRTCVNLLALAGRIDDAGRLGCTEEIAYALRLSHEQTHADLEELKKVRVTLEKKGVWYLKNFDKRNERPPSSRREAVKDRVKKYRETKAIQEEVKQIGNEPVTTLHDVGNDTRIDKNRVEEIREEKPIGADAPAHPEPKPKNARGDPRTKTPEVQTFRQVTGKYPNTALYDQVIKSIQGKSTEQLKPFYAEWVSRGYNPAGIKWLTEWAVMGSIPSNGHKPNLIVPPTVPRPTYSPEEQERIKADLRRIKSEKEARLANGNAV